MYTQRVLKKPHVHDTAYNPRHKEKRPGEAMVVIVSYELGDDVVDQELRPEVVAKVIKLVKKQLRIKRLDQEELARVRTFLQSDKGKAWCK